MLSSFFQELSEKLHRDGFEVVNFYLKHKSEYFNHQGVHIQGEKNGNYFQNYYHICKIIQQTKPSAVISNFSYVNPALLFGKLLGIKHNIVWFHTVYGHGKPNKQKLLIKRLFLKMADSVIANSSLLQNEIHEIYKVKKEQVHSIPFWTNISNYRSDSNHMGIQKTDAIINLGCPGRLVADKNHALVIKALSQLKKEYTATIRLYIAGDGHYKRELQELVNSLQLESDVVFLGLLTAKEMLDFYDAMNVVVLPSFHEAFGLVFIEAIALGTPVLVSNAFGALGFINNEKFPLDDISFNPHALQELIDKLEPYIRNEGLDSDYFRTIYNVTFEKEIIYDKIKAVILNQN